MKFDLEGELFMKFHDICDENHAWYNTTEGRLYTWDETFELMGFKTHEERGYGHWLSDEEYVWFMLRFS